MKKSRTVPTAGLVGLLPLLAGQTSAQVPSDAFLFVNRTNGILYSFDPGVSLVARSYGFGPYIAACGSSIVFNDYYESISNVSYVAAELDLQQGTYAGLLNALPTPMFGSAMFAAGEDRLWIVGRYGGDVASVARNGQIQTAMLHGTAFSVPPNGGVQSVETNGRDVFLTAGPSLLAFDTERPFAVRTLFQGGVRNLMMGRDGLIMFTGGVGAMSGLIGVDPVTGTWAWLLPGSELAGGNTFGYDPWTDMLMGTDFWIWWRQIGAPVGAPWQAMLWNPQSANTISDIATNAERPFVIRGSGCANALGLEPRLGWAGLPRQGGSFDLKLRRAEPNGVAVFWFGRSAAFWSLVGSLPFDAGPLGAPGCRILAAADFSMVAPVDAQGSAVLTSAVPVDPAIAGFKLHAQTASLSGANALGLATSESLVIRFR